MTKYIHAFSDPITDEIDQSLIGNKGYNLCLMHGMDLPIPEGFIINANATKAVSYTHLTLPTKA